MAEPAPEGAADHPEGAADHPEARLLVVDDQPVVRRGLLAYLGGRPGIDVVGEAGTGEEALALLDDLTGTDRPDVVLMDLAMPGMGGVAATAHIAADHPEVAVLVLTSLTTDDDVLAAVRAGASGYVVKDAQPAELEAAIQAVAGGEIYLHPAAAGAVVHAVTATEQDGGPRGAEPAGLAELTDREREVLGWLAEGLTNAALAERLFISEKTVKTHVSSILAKLGVADRTQAALLAVRAGIGADPAPGLGPGTEAETGP